MQWMCGCGRVCAWRSPFPLHVLVCVRRACGAPHKKFHRVQLVSLPAEIGLLKKLRTLVANDNKVGSRAVCVACAVL